MSPCKLAAVSSADAFAKFRKSARNESMANYVRVLPASLNGKTINYTVGMRPRLERQITDGRFEIGDNLIENAIRPIALRRKNYLFAASHKEAQNAALIYSVLVTAQYHDVNPAE